MNLLITSRKEQDIITELQSHIEIVTCLQSAKIDADMIFGHESALMKLSETIDSSHLTQNERSELVWEALA